MLTSCNPHYLLHQAVCHTGSGGPTDSCVAAASHVLAHNPLMHVHSMRISCRVYFRKFAKGGGQTAHKSLWGGNMKTRLTVYEETHF